MHGCTPAAGGGAVYIDEVASALPSGESGALYAAEASAPLHDALLRV